MKLSLAVGNRGLSIAFIDASGVPQIVAPEECRAFPMHLWCNGSSVLFGEDARRRYFENGGFFFTDLVDDLRLATGEQRTFRLGGRTLGITGVLALLFSRGVRDPLVRELTRRGEIRSLSERFEVTLCLPDGLTPDGESSLLSAIEAADLAVTGTVPEYVAAIHGYDLQGLVGRRFLHLDIGRDLKMSFLEVLQDQQVKLRERQVVPGLGTEKIDDLVSVYLRHAVERAGGSAETRWAPKERYLLDREIEKAIAAICREGIGSHEFRFPAGNDTTITLHQRVQGSARLAGGSPRFAFRERMADFFTQVFAHLDTFRKESRDGASIEEVILSGGGCSYPFVAERLGSELSSKGKQTLHCRWGYGNVLAIGTALATAADAFTKHVPTGNDHAIRDLIAPVVLAEGGAQTGDGETAVPAIEAGARVDIPPGTTRLLLRVAGGAGMRVRMNTEGEGPVREWTSGTPAGAPSGFPEILPDGTVHVDVSRPRSARFTAALASDVDLAPMEYTLEIRDFLTGSLICRFKNEVGKLRGPIKVLLVAEIYYYETKKSWRIRGLLEPRSSPAHTPEAPALDPPKPQPQPPAQLVAEKALVRGERVDLAESSYIVAAADDSLTLVVLSFSDPAADAIAAVSSERENRHGDAVNFRGRAKVGVKLAGTSEKRLGVAVMGEGIAPRDLRFEIRNAADNAVLYSYIHLETVLNLPASFIEFYVHKDRWRLKVTGESVGLTLPRPERAGLAPARASYDPGALPEQVLGGKYPVPAAFGGKMRLDFIGAFPEPFDAFVATSMGTTSVRSEPYFEKLSKTGHPRPQDSETVFSMDLVLSPEHHQEYRTVVSQVIGFVKRVVVVNPETQIGIARYDVDPHRRYATPCSIVRVYRHKGEWRYAFEDDRFTP